MRAPLVATGACMALTLVTYGTGGCSNSNDAGASLDCAWLASDNCWKTTAAAAASCLPATSAMGKLSADLTTCTYPTGQVVTFDPPLTLPLPEQPLFNFSITTNGMQCFAFHQPNQGGFTMTTSAGTVTTGGSLAYSVSCPDGSKYSTTDALELLACDAGTFGGLPGDFEASTNTSVTMSVLGTGEMAVEVLNCQM
jgi:hypothetical protein